MKLLKGEEVVLAAPAVGEPELTKCRVDGRKGVEVAS